MELLLHLIFLCPTYSLTDELLTAESWCNKLHMCASRNTLRISSQVQACKITCVQCRQAIAFSHAVHLTLYWICCHHSQQPAQPSNARHVLCLHHNLPGPAGSTKGSPLLFLASGELGWEAAAWLSSAVSWLVAPCWELFIFWEQWLTGVLPLTAQGLRLAARLATFRTV